MATAIGAGIGPPRGPSLRVCADPDYLPFSNRRREGFENRIADLLARDLNLDPVFVWREQRLDSVGEGVAIGECNVVMGVPADLTQLKRTRPYYRASVASPRGPFESEIAIGVRKGDTALVRGLDAALSARRSEVARILSEFGVTAVAPRSVVTP